MSVDILIIEDDPSLSRFLSTTLAAQGYAVTTAMRADEALARVALDDPALILLDLGLPDGDGLMLLPELKARCDAQILVVSARTQESDKISALDAGAEDYLTKPFSVAELLARLRVAQRRRLEAMPVAQQYAVGELRVDLEKHQVWLADEALKLTPKEFQLLAILAQSRGRVVTHAQLLQAIWGRHHSDDTHYLRIYLRQLRQKIEPNPSEPRYLLTEPGVGYRLADA
ncbi:MAG: response regulator transcription factor [Pseudomonadota bacterium]